MIGQTLQRLIQDGHTSVREVSELVGVAPSTVYRWMACESVPDFDSVCRLVRLLPSEPARRTIVLEMLACTPFQAINTEQQLDINGDGEVDLNDALDAAIVSIRRASDSLTAMRSLPADSDDATPMAAQVIPILDDVVRSCTVAQQVVTQLAETSRRRKARPLS